MWRTFRLFYFGIADELALRFPLAAEEPVFYNDAGATGDASFPFLLSQ